MPAVTIVYDLVTFERGMRPNRRSIVIERLTLGAAVRRSRALLCISQATADALEARFPRRPRRRRSRLWGCLRCSRAPAVGELEELPSPGFVLAVGTLEPRKNLPRLVAAYRAAAAATPGAPSARGGRGALAGRPVRRWMRCDRSASAAMLLGHVSDAALAELYRRCAVFCYPSLGEGFGLPVLEAMAAGAAVLTSNSPRCPRSAAKPSSMSTRAHVASIAGGLARLLDSPARRAELSELARERARKFSWARFAERTLAVLERVAARLSRPGALRASARRCRPRRVDLLHPRHVRRRARTPREATRVSTRARSRPSPERQSPDRLRGRPRVVRADHLHARAPGEDVVDARARA